LLSFPTFDAVECCLKMKQYHLRPLSSPVAGIEYQKVTVVGFLDLCYCQNCLSYLKGDGEAYVNVETDDKPPQDGGGLTMYGNCEHFLRMKVQLGHT